MKYRNVGSENMCFTTANREWSTSLKTNLVLC
jgi:hypothetical protein